MSFGAGISRGALLASRAAAGCAGRRPARARAPALRRSLRGAAGGRRPGPGRARGSPFLFGDASAGGIMAILAESSE
eukprot:4542903-Pyramimonas_sp.AAC.1